MLEAGRNDNEKRMTVMNKEDNKSADITSDVYAPTEGTLYKLPSHHKTSEATSPKFANQPRKKGEASSQNRTL